MKNYKHIQAFKYKEIFKSVDSRILRNIGIWVFRYPRQILTNIETLEYVNIWVYGDLRI